MGDSDDEEDLLVLARLLPGLSRGVLLQLLSHHDWPNAIGAALHAGATGRPVPDEVAEKVVQLATAQADSPADLQALDRIRAHLRSGGTLGMPQPELPPEQSSAVSEPEPDPAQVDFVLKEMRSALDAQWDQWKHLETRLQFALGWLITATGLCVVLGVGKSIPNRGTLMLLAGSGFFAIWALGVLVLAYIPLGFLRPPEPVGFSERYLLETPNETKLMLIDTIARAYTSNQVALDRRTARLRRAFESAAVAAVLAILGLASTVA